MTPGTRLACELLWTASGDDTRGSIALRPAVMAGLPGASRDELQHQQQYAQDQYYAMLQQHQAGMHPNHVQQQSYPQMQAVQPQQLQGAPQHQHHLSTPASSSQSRESTSSSGRQQQQSQSGIEGEQPFANRMNSDSPAIKQRRDSFDGDSSNGKEGNGAAMNKDGQPHKFSRSKGVSNELYRQAYGASASDGCDERRLDMLDTTLRPAWNPAHRHKDSATNACTSSFPGLPAM